MSHEYLNFSEISQNIPFEKVLNWLNISYIKNPKEIKGDGFIISIEKNLFTNPKNKEQKGSIINFLAIIKDIDLRTAALELKNQFLKNESLERNELKKIPELELHYTDQLMTYGISKEIALEYEIGLVKQPSIMSGKIALKVYNPDKSVAGYVGYNIKDGSWFFPKGFKRPLWNLCNLKESKFIFLVTNPFDALKVISFGYSFVACLLATSMTEEQCNQLKELNNLEKILLLHPDPFNILGRISNFVYTKYAIPPESLREIDQTQFLNLFSFKGPHQ